MRCIIVTGGSAGLGAAFIDAYRSADDTRILSVDKQHPAQLYANVTPYLVDISAQSSIEQFVRQIRDTAIDLVIHCAGIRGLVPAAEIEHPDDVAACETLSMMDNFTLENTFRVNAIGTFMLLKALAPNLRLSSGAKVVIMSSRMGSIGNNQVGKKDAGSAYAYRASKAALNTIVRSFAVDEPTITFVLCHPGRVETKLVKCKEAGAISAEESVRDMLPLIESWNEDDSGHFYDRCGQAIEW